MPVAKIQLVTATILVVVVITISFSTKDDSERCSSSRHSLLYSRNQTLIGQDPPIENERPDSRTLHWRTGGPDPGPPFSLHARRREGRMRMPDLRRSADLALQEDRDHEAVDRDRLDQRETDD